MIYKKSANFPYPILSGISREMNDQYADGYFYLKVEVTEDTDHFYFDFTYELDSPFMNRLIEEGKAQMILVLQTRDSQFYRLSPTDRQVKIAKNRISLKNRTEIQLHIQALESINFAENHDLNPFYDQYKQSIHVDRYALLGYSNVVTFNGNMKKPFDLFDQRYNENLSSDIKFELGTESIIIHYRNRDYFFQGMQNAATLTNAYVYTGLSRALHQFIINNDEDQDGEVELDDLDEPIELLDIKLLNLMRSKQVEVLNTENIDEVIYNISDRVIERFVTAIRRLGADGN